MYKNPRPRRYDLTIKYRSKVKACNPRQIYGATKKQKNKKTTTINS